MYGRSILDAFSVMAVKWPFTTPLKWMVAGTGVTVPWAQFG